MRFEATEFPDVLLIHENPVLDERGFFSRSFCVKEFGDQGLATDFPQHSRSFSKMHGTVRGMHLQTPPHGEVKIVTCVSGVIWDVVVDMRPDSPHFLQWRAFTLTGEDRTKLYIPSGFAHGFQTLEGDTEVHYLISAFYNPAAAKGFRYDDEAFAIQWPLPVSVISEKDKSWPLLPRRND